MPFRVRSAARPPCGADFSFPHFCFLLSVFHPVHLVHNSSLRLFLDQGLAKRSARYVRSVQGSGLTSMAGRRFVGSVPRGRRDTSPAFPTPGKHSDVARVPNGTAECGASLKACAQSLTTRPTPIRPSCPCVLSTFSSSFAPFPRHPPRVQRQRPPPGSRCLTPAKIVKRFRSFRLISSVSIGCCCYSIPPKKGTFSWSSDIHIKWDWKRPRPS